MRVGGRFILIFVLTLLASLQAAADEPPTAWTAWLHYGRHMTLIDSNGDTLREVDLPIPEFDPAAYYNFSREIGITKDSRVVAYLLTPFTEPTRLITFDTAVNEIQAVFSPDGSPLQGLAYPTQWSFNESDTAFVTAYTPTSLDIHMDVLDVESAAVIHSVDITTASLGLASDLQVWQVSILRYVDGEVNFALNLMDPDAGDPNIGSIERFINRFFTWNTLTGDIRPDIIFSNLESDIFSATDEIITTAYNSDFPTDMFEEGYPLDNVLQTYDPTIDAVFPFYQADAVFPRSVSFVQNGTRILANLLDRNRDNLGWYWALLERDGTIVDEWVLPENLQIDTVENTPNGFLYTLSLKTDEWTWYPLPAVYEADTRDNKLDVGQLVWQTPMREFHAYFDYPWNSYFDIAWVPSDAPVGLFKPWAQLADPVYAPAPQPSDVTITPTLIPTPPPLFHVGQTVRVQTIDGEILNLRAEPTRKSEIVVYIEDDTHLELLEGPVEAEGFSWWRVRLPDDLEGWVVENDGELQTLMPHSP
jgi:hypothetical protein